MQNKEWLTSDDILGKDVIDTNGEFIGITDKIYFDKKTVECLSISVDKGFLRKGFIIGKDYISRITKHAIFLNIQPVFSLKEMIVFDVNGTYIGEVMKVQLQESKNIVDSILVKTKLFKGTKTITIQSSDILNVHKNIVLKKEYSEL